ncbi:ureidoglycolate hydrolase [Cladophialophora yegresii CBS 114405]|uniref:Ureidoglycolate hydrolase n=1 Tax=Cladophialophora yegresii CBS 114405 TaxID=1182544 RepID=W9VTU4_9EURO|nr:ureidoglycolate hydrolase [Cladophialophora yegresii CBS 114405]EXJ56435.1 ureidoglycolate hydrolase [Cladophialophora yegresii CBS 114405]
MPPPTLPPPSTHPHSHVEHLKLEPLTPSSFAEFGTAISSPFPPTLTHPPRTAETIPPPLHAPHQPTAVLANQNSALKTSPISLFVDNYPVRPPTTPRSTPQMSMFSCFPRNLSGIGIDTTPSSSSSSGGLAFKADILERHPYTTQTFAPLGLSAGESDKGSVFLVVVAPSLPGSVKATFPDGTSKVVTKPPDLSRLRAFVARGDQAVTYAAGTWHAPMVVLGQKRVDFLVTQFVNKVAEDDCQEVLLGSNSLRVDLKGLGLQDEKSGTAKL